MTWSNLTAELQDIYLQEFSTNAKWVFFISVILLSCIYLFYIWKKQTPTKFFLTAISRVFLFGLSISTLLASPFLFIGLSPEYSFWDFYSPFLAIYGIIISILIIAFIVDLLRFGVPTLLKFGGLDWNDPNVREIYGQLKNNKHLIKW